MGVRGGGKKTTTAYNPDKINQPYYPTLFKGI
jgi:hypothetical protein